MSQSSIHDYYTSVKKRSDETSKDDGKLLLSNSIERNIETDLSPFKVPTTPVPKTRRTALIKQREVKSESIHLSKKSSRITLDDNQESILKWTKRTINFNESSAEKRKRLEINNGDKETVQRSPIDQSTTDERPTTDQTVQSNRSPTKTTVKKRLFDTGSELDKIRERIKDMDETFLNKLKDFKSKTASPIKLELDNLNSPTKRLKEREERRAKAKELIELSPKKFLKDKLSNSPVKSPVKPQVDGLNLPRKYNSIVENFIWIDSVASILLNRKETCTFDKLKSSVQRKSKKNFELSHLAQILTVYPTAFILGYEKKTAIDNLNNLKVLSNTSPFYLVVKPKINSLEMTPSVCEKRREEFASRLKQLVKKMHSDFLLSLNPPVVIKDEELTRWHPSFVFPNIPETILPEPPKSINETKSLNKFWTTKGLEAEQPSVPKVTQAQVEERKTKIKKGILKGLSQEFLDKIKNKEATNLIKEMTRKPEIEKRIVEIKRLPELIRIIHSHFTTEKKKAILLSDVIQKCMNSSTSFSGGSCSNLIQLINELLPDWLLMLNTTQGKFVKINKETVLKSLYDRLDRCVIKLKEI